MNIKEHYTGTKSRLTIAVESITLRIDPPNIHYLISISQDKFSKYERKENKKIDIFIRQESKADEFYEKFIELVNEYSTNI